MSSPALSRYSEDGISMGEKSSSAMTWLQAAEHVLREEGPDMHIRELTSRIMELGMVKSNCTTSLETLLYRQTSNSNSVSRFVRVSGKHGWFGLRDDCIEAIPLSKKVGVESGPVKMESCDFSEEQAEADFNKEEKVTEAIPSVSAMLDSLYGFDSEFEPRVFHTSRQRKHSCPNPASGESSSDDEGVNRQCPPKKRDMSSDEESITDETAYRKKYYFIKKIAKTIIFENAALSDQLTLTNDQITRAEVERRFLLDKLVNFERTARLNLKTTSVAHHHTTYQNHPSPKASFTKPSKHLKPRKPISQRENRPKPPTHLHTQHRTISTGTRAEAKNVRLGVGSGTTRKLVMSDSSESSESESDSESIPVKGRKKAGPKVKKEPVEGGDGGQLELAMRCGKVRRLHPIALNSDGSPVFPIVIGGLKVHNLGKIVHDRPAYHSERYLLPVGFESSRTYPSMIDPTRKSLYTCRILDGGETPMFEMVADDDPEHPVRAASSTACQTIVLRNINKARDKQATNSGSGPEFFGYSNPTVLNLLQRIPDSRKCTKYKFVRFAEPQRRPRKPPGSPSVTKQPPGFAKKKMMGRPPKDLSKRKSSNMNKMDIGGVTKKTEDSGLAIAPVFGGMDTVSYSSSDDGSLSSEGDLIIDG